MLYSEYIYIYTVYNTHTRYTYVVCVSWNTWLYNVIYYLICYLGASYYVPVDEVIWLELKITIKICLTLLTVFIFSSLSPGWLTGFRGLWHSMLTPGSLLSSKAWLQFRSSPSSSMLLFLKLNWFVVRTPYFDLLWTSGSTLDINCMHRAKVQMFHKKSFFVHYITFVF